MPSPPVLDFDKLLKPISADKPTGADPRLDISPSSIYQKIRDERKVVREAEKRAISPDPANPSEPPNWKPLRDLCVKALSETAKDLEITTYLIEALLRLHSFAGLRDGFRLARELAEKYWDNLYPLPTEDVKDEEGRIEEYGIRTRIAQLIGLNGEDSEGALIAPIARVPITESTSVGEFALVHYNEARNLKRISDPKLIEKRVAAGAVTMEMFEKAVSETRAEFYKKLDEDLKECEAEFTKLGAVLDTKCNGHGMPTTEVKRALTTGNDRGMSGVQATLQAVAKDKLAGAPKPAEAGAKPADPASPGGAAAAPAPPPGVIQTRQQALESLRKVSEFFRTTEPHSPLSYTLDQVVRWAGMAFAELWTELIADEAPRKSVFKQVGVKPPDPKDQKK